MSDKMRRWIDLHADRAVTLDALLVLEDDDVAGSLPGIKFL
jgi:hypothetical protein